MSAEQPTPESIVCPDPNNCDRKHVGGMGGTPVHLPADGIVVPGHFDHGVPSDAANQPTPDVETAARLIFDGHEEGFRDLYPDNYIPNEWESLDPSSRSTWLIAAQVLLASDWLADLICEREAKMLDDTAKAWRWSQWSDVLLPKPKPPALPEIAYANRVGDWIAARATKHRKAIS